MLKYVVKFVFILWVLSPLLGDISHFEAMKHSNVTVKTAVQARLHLTYNILRYATVW